MIQRFVIGLKSNKIVLCVEPSCVHSFDWLILGAVIQLTWCCLASGNLWLSFQFKRRIQGSGSWGGKCVLYRSCKSNNHVYFWLPFINVTFEVLDKRFSQDTEVHSRHVLEQKMHPFSLCFPQTVTNELLIEIETRHLNKRWQQTITLTLKVKSRVAE